MEIKHKHRDLFTALRRGDLENIASLLKDITINDEEIIESLLPVLTLVILLPDRDSYDSSSDAVLDIRCKVSECRAADSIMRLMEAVNTVTDTLISDKEALFSLSEHDKVLSTLKEIGNPFDSCASPADLKYRVLFGRIQLFLAGGFDDISALDIEALQDEYYSNEVCCVLCLGLYHLPSHYISQSDLCKCLLYCAQGPNIIQNIVLNSPSAFHTVIQSLISDANCTEDICVNERRMDAIMKLVDLAPDTRDEVLSTLLNNRTLPNLCINLMCQIDSNYDFANCLLAGLVLEAPDRSSECCWLANYIQNLMKKHTSSCDLEGLENRLLGCVNDFTTFVVDSKMDNNLLTTASSFIRLVCALKTIVSFKFFDDVLSGLLSLLTCKVEPCQNGIDVIKTSLATILVCPTLINAPGGGSSLEAEKLVTDWVQWLISDPLINKIGGVDELLLLIAIHFHSGQLHNVVTLASTILGFKVNVSVKLLSRLRTLFTLDLLPEHIVAMRSAQVSVTQKLSQSTTAFLPVHCVLHLLKHKAFVKHSVSIQDWIICQVEECCLPVHCAIVELLEAYARSCIHGLPRHSHGQRGSNPPLHQQKLKTFFADDDLFEESKLAQRVLVLFYLLTYEDIYQLEAKKFVDNAQGKPFQYSEQLWQDIPVKFLIRTVIYMPHKFTSISSPLMRLVAAHCPYLIGDVHQTPAKADMFAFHRKGQTISNKDLEIAYNDAVNNPGRCVQLLTHLSHMPLRSQLHVLDAFVSGIPNVIQSNSHATALAFKEVWIQLEAFFPRRMYCKTMSVLCNQIVTHEELVADPLLIFRIDKPLFRMRPLSECMLRTLRFYLLASRASLSRQLSLALTSHDLSPAALSGVRAEREELMRALVGAQESAAVQMMLEICLPLPNENEEGLSELSEIRCLICIELHQMFIADPLLCKVVHFQGYPLSLLPVVVKGVPSMHICIDFIPQLLCQDDIEKRTFGLELLSLLCVQYPIVKGMSCAHQAVTVLSTFVSSQAPACSVSLMQHSVQALLRICNAFPPLRKEVHSLLMTLASLCKSRLAVNQGGPTLLSSRIRTNSMESQLLAQVQTALATLPST